MKKNQKVKIYSAANCPHCRTAKRFLDAHRVSYEDIDVTKNRAAYEVMLAKSGQSGVPVMEVGDEIIVGFNYQNLQKIVNPPENIFSKIKRFISSENTNYT